MKPIDWPGWSVENNPYGPGFDTAARARMIAASALIDPILAKYLPVQRAVEIGPLFNPHITLRNNPGERIYIEKDSHAARWLRQYGTSIRFDLASLPDHAALDTTIPEHSIDLVVVSHVLNYVDYTRCIDYCAHILRPGGYLIISNITNHGAPEHFSKKRPKRMSDIIGYARQKHDIVEKHIVPSEEPRHQKNKTLIVIARRQLT